MPNGRSAWGFRVVTYCGPLRKNLVLDRYPEETKSGTKEIKKQDVLDIVREWVYFLAVVEHASRPFRRARE